MTHATLHQFLDQYQTALASNKDVVRWRLSLTTSESSTAGFSKKSVVDIYQPASQQSATHLSFAVELTGQRIAYGRINPTQTDAASMLDMVGAAAILSEEPLPLAPKAEQSDLPNLMAPEGYPKQLLTDLLPQATELREALLATDPKAFEGELSGSYGKSAYLDSNGLHLTSEATNFSGFFELDGKLDTNKSEHQIKAILPTLLDRVEPLGKHSKALERSRVQPKQTRLPVLVVSGGGLIDSYLLGNINGMRIIDGSSPYSLDDFTNHLAVAHPAFTLHFNQLRHLDNRSFAFTGEGITGQQFTLIDKGRLTEPVCGLKAATRLGFVPRVVGEATDADSIKPVSFTDVTRELDAFLLVFHAMGLHTQNTTLGTYSMPCPDSLYFENGELVGPAKAVITGNFFDVMKSADMRFVSSPLFEDPLLQFETDVTFS